MDAPQYHQFGADNTSGRGPQGIAAQLTGKRLASVLYGLLVLLLVTLLLVTGIKFSQLNSEITDVKSSLGKIRAKLHTSHGTSSSTSEQTEVYFDAVTPVKGPCDEGWGFFSGSCYMLSPTSLSWKEAEKECQAHRAHLLVVNNVEELDYISKVVEVRLNYWIGLVERHQEDDWSWVDGTDFKTTATFWDEGQPDDWEYRVNGEDCGQLHSSQKRKRKMWNDAECTLKYHYICEARR